MATDTAPTIAILVTEGLRKAGILNPRAGGLAYERAQSEWMPEIKNDIWSRAKKLKSLHKTAVGITTEGVDRYALPTDFSSDLTLNILDGLNTGTAQAGAVGSITLAAAEAISEATLKQRKGILVYSGTGKNSFSQVTAFNTSTKVATVNPNFATAPANGDSYMIVDTVSPVLQNSIQRLDRMIRGTGGTGKPEIFYPKGDADNGEFVLYPKPYRSSGVPYGMQLRYYADLMLLDLSSTLLSTLYRRWRNVFLTGLRFKALQSQDTDGKDKRIEGAKIDYRSELSDLIGRETYGVDLSDTQIIVDNLQTMVVS
jgi:hypothetical protein